MTSKYTRRKQHTELGWNQDNSGEIFYHAHWGPDFYVRIYQRLNFSFNENSPNVIAYKIGGLSDFYFQSKDPWYSWMIISFSDQLLGLPFLIKQARFLQDLFIPNIRIFQDISIAMRDKILGEWTSFWFGLVQIRRKPLKKNNLWRKWGRRFKLYFIYPKYMYERIDKWWRGLLRHWSRTPRTAPIPWAGTHTRQRCPRSGVGWTRKD